MNCEQKKSALAVQIQGLTHKQLVRYAKFLNVKLGDYMKMDKAALITKLYDSCDFASEAGIDGLTTMLATAFPQGIYTKGQKHGYGVNNASPQVPASPVIPSQPYIAPQVSGDAANQLAALLAQLAGNRPGVDEFMVRSIVKAELGESKNVYRVNVSLPNRPEIITPETARHEAFTEVLTHVAAGNNVLLVGPAGCGKTHLADQVAQAMGLEFRFTGAVGSEYKLLGFNDAHGHYVSTEYRKSYENGGLFLWDELDGSAPQALLAFNAGLANGHQDFPDCVVKRHKSFHTIASANTYGHGADRQYVGRNQLDAASLDRFAVVSMGYDEKLERALYGDDLWVEFVHKARKAVQGLSIRHVVSMRAIDQGQKALAAGMPLESVKKACLWKHLAAADVAKI